jgi:hypothetical protein
VIFTKTSQNNEREEVSFRKVAYEEARVDLSDITAPVGKCKQCAEITMNHGMWGMTLLKPSIGESESIEEHVQCVWTRPCPRRTWRLLKDAGGTVRLWEVVNLR